MTITSLCQKCQRKFTSERSTTLCENCTDDDSESILPEIVEDIFDAVSDALDIFDSDD